MGHCKTIFIEKITHLIIQLNLFCLAVKREDFVHHSLLTVLLLNYSEYSVNTSAYCKLTYLWILSKYSSLCLCNCVLSFLYPVSHSIPQLYLLYFKLNGRNLSIHNTLKRKNSLWMGTRLLKSQWCLELVRSSMAMMNNCLPLWCKWITKEVLQHFLFCLIKEEWGSWKKNCLVNVWQDGEH